MGNEDYLHKITDYLRKNLKKGYTLDSLKWALIGQGYSKTSVERAIDEFNKELAKQAPILKEKPVIKYEIIDENNNPIRIKRPWWKKILDK
ncbi:MAG: hypothetical protein KKB79_00940 [Nanoarchaeota archaeon]|nr:hypothetical protein [Nanoarchaeota archaeon]